jgi:EAL domain-containing protein (putative c-di-GMP-specific phosphodiesterase class I)
VTAHGESDPELLLRHADVAMHRAKDSSRGGHLRFDPSMGRRSEERVRIEVELRAALRNDELRVHYQPIVCGSTGEVASLEALVRGRHPTRGLVSPGLFVPVAEDSGLVVELGRFVLGEACRQLAEWRRGAVVDPGVGVAVNVSARQLALPEFPEEVARALRAAGLDDEPGLLSLEITETVLMADESHAAVLADLATLGVGLSLDDFGTGASALARLKRFPVDTVKIDRSFVSGLGQPDGADDAIIAAIMALARALGLEVIAEGVETVEQLERLLAMGCERIQGYLFSKPLEPEALEEEVLHRPMVLVTY